MVEHRVQSVFGIIICIIQFGIDYETVTYFGPLLNMFHWISHDYEKPKHVLDSLRLPTLIVRKQTQHYN